MIDSHLLQPLLATLFGALCVASYIYPDVLRALGMGVLPYIAIMVFAPGEFETVLSTYISLSKLMQRPRPDVVRLAPMRLPIGGVARIERPKHARKYVRYHAQKNVPTEQNDIGVPGQQPKFATMRTPATTFREDITSFNKTHENTGLPIGELMLNEMLREVNNEIGEPKENRKNAGCQIPTKQSSSEYNQWRNPSTD